MRPAAGLGHFHNNGIIYILKRMVCSCILPAPDEEIHLLPDIGSAAVPASPPPHCPGGSRGGGTGGGEEGEQRYEPVPKAEGTTGLFSAQPVPPGCEPTFGWWAGGACPAAPGE